VRTIQQKHFRILAVAPSSRGFGFAVLEGEQKLADWGLKIVSRDKNSSALTKVEDMLLHYGPGLVVLEDAVRKGSGRSPRIRALTTAIVALAKSRNVTVALFSRENVLRVFFPDGDGTKQALAEALAARFADELSSRLPPKRRPWTSEDSRRDIFMAVALALMFRLKIR
jgi:GNAT superfamily N-acetyltransferase